MIPIVEAREITKMFPMAAGPVTAVQGVSLCIEPADYVAIWGPSGCGKSTLMHILGCVDTPSSGALLFEGRDVSALPDAARSDMRLAKIGFVFQRFFLLPMLTAWENVELPQAELHVGSALQAQGVPSLSSAEARRARTAELLEYVGLAHRAHHRPSQLSGGEMQRVAIARALANRPVLLLADEPTGELDRATGEHIAALFDRVHQDGTAIVIVTHDQTIASRAGRTLVMRDGRIEREEVTRLRPTFAPDGASTSAATAAVDKTAERQGYGEPG